MTVLKIATKDSKLVELLEKQIEVETRTLNMLAEVEETVSETAVKLAFMELRLDSWKHKKFLEGMIDMLKTTPCDNWSAKVQRYIDRVKLERTVQTLMNDEKEMLELVEQSLTEVDDPMGTFLLSHLRDDEKDHFENLKNLIKMIKTAPLQPVKGQKGTDIVCETED